MVGTDHTLSLQMSITHTSTEIQLLYLCVCVCVDICRESVHICVCHLPQSITCTLMWWPFCWFCCWT